MPKNDPEYERGFTDGFNTGARFQAERTPPPLSIITPDAEQLSELRRAMQFQYDALCELCEDGLSLPPSVHARLANMRDDAAAVLTP